MRNLKIIILFIAVFVFYQSQAQTDALAYADSITKATGITYMNMFGTKVFIPKPGQNWAVRKNINVLEIYTDSGQVTGEINIWELPLYALVNVPDNTAPAPFSIQGYTGRLLRSSNGEATSLTLIFEDDEAKILIQIKFIDVDREEDYISLLKNVRYNKNVKTNTRLLPFLARFTIDAASSGYEVIGVSKGAYWYSPKGVKPKSMSEPQMWITEHNTIDITALRYLDLPALPYGLMTDSIITNVEEPIIDGFKVYTTVTYIGVAPNQLMVYQVARTNGIISVVMAGAATADFEKNKALFEKMAETLHVRGTDEIKLFDH